MYTNIAITARISKYHISKHYHNCLEVISLKPRAPQITRYSLKPRELATFLNLSKTSPETQTSLISSSRIFRSYSHISVLGFKIGLCYNSNVRSQKQCLAKLGGMYVKW